VRYGTKEPAGKETLVSYARNIVARRLSLRAFSLARVPPGVRSIASAPLSRNRRGGSAGLRRPHNRASFLSPIAIIRHSDADSRGNQAEMRVPSRNVRSAKSLIVQRTRIDARMRCRLQITEFTGFVKQPAVAIEERLQLLQLKIVTKKKRKNLRECSVCHFVF